MASVAIPPQSIEEWNRLNATVENLRQQNVEGQLAEAQRDVQAKKQVRCGTAAGSCFRASVSACVRSPV